MSCIIIIHFAPIELYPPIQNLLHVLDRKENASNVVLITTNPTVNSHFVTATHIKIIRKGKTNVRSQSWFRYINYWYFYFSCIRLLIHYRPTKVVYFETLSSLPVYIYKRYINPAVGIFIHYHEYTSQKEYRTGMRLSRLFHQLEKELYPSSRWVSHTNAMRMDKFKQDLAPVCIACSQLLPNYPPASWRKHPKSKLSLPIKIVYAGALSLSTMYTKEFAHWVLEQHGNVIWDIYSFNYTQEAKDYVSALNSPWINMKEGVDYTQLAEVYPAYDVGIILYNGHTPNYVYNAPNKLFEYLACGLDVLFPKEMVGCYPYATENCYPKVICIDYQNLQHLDLKMLLSKELLSCKESSFYCEPVYEKFYSTVIKA